MSDSSFDSLPVKDFCEKHKPWPTESTVRWWIFNAKTNDFDTCIRRIGKRILISESGFAAWVEAQNQKATQ